MEKNEYLYLLIVGFGLLFLIPAIESLDKSLSLVTTVLVVGYWGGLGFLFLFNIVKRFFSEYSFGVWLYNIWLFFSLMCIAIGVSAIVDDGLEKAPWAALLIFYGGTVAFLNRSEL